MWNVPSYRIRAYVRNLRKNRKTQATKKYPPLHLKRTTAEISVQNHDENVISLLGTREQRQIVRATVLLNDMTQRGVFMFTANPIPVGAVVSLTIHGPRRFYVKARVMLCKQISLYGGTISTDTVYPYRVGMLFEFSSVEERLAVKRYFDDLSFRYLRSAAC